MTSVKPTSFAKFAERTLHNFDAKILDSKIFNDVYKYAGKHPERFAAQMALISALTKDAIGCYYYVHQSLNNERIPDDKRNFVAALDLMNGILNITLQLTIGLMIDRKAPKWFDATVGKMLSQVNTRKITSKILPIIHLDKNHANMTFEQVENFLRNKLLGSGGKASKWLKVGFGAAIMLTATQVFTKRVVVPFFSTPLATWYKENYMDKKKKTKQNDPAVSAEPLVNKLPYNWTETNSSDNKQVFKNFMK